MIFTRGFHRENRPALVLRKASGVYGFCEQRFRELHRNADLAEQFGAVIGAQHFAELGVQLCELLA